MLHFVFRCPTTPGQTARRQCRPRSAKSRWCELDELPPPISDFTENRIRDALGTGFTYRVVTERVWRT